LHEIAFLDFDFALIVQEFLDRNIGLGFQASIDNDEVVVDRDDFGGNDFTLAHFLAGQGLFKKLSKRFHYGVTFSCHERMSAAG